MKKILVTGAGGFIGHHLVAALKAEGHHVVGVDVKPPEFEPTCADRFVLHDIRESTPALRALFVGMDEVYALAADMGGMGFISKCHATILRNNTTIDLNTVEAARLGGVGRYFYASSACVYPHDLQADPSGRALAEHMAYPAGPEGGYGWEKLYGERIVDAYHDEFGLDVRVARFHNVYGTHGAWDGGREKAPAAICRKVAEAVLHGRGAIEIWGDGEQTRSFCYVRDCIDGIARLMASPVAHPLNIGSDELVSINELADLVMAAAGVRLDKVHTPGPQGVRGRNSDNALIRSTLGWAPSTPLAEGIAATYPWIRAQVEARGR
jgi:nucleoside-diphosphate-sugar epimerase